MSTDAIEQVEDTPGRDDGFDTPLRPVAGELGEEATKDETAIAWLPEADEETIKYVTSKGFDKDPSKAIASQREAERALRREQEARASMEEELAELREQMAGIQTQGQQASPDQDPFGVLNAYRAWENGEIDAAQLGAIQQNAMAEMAYRIAQGMVGEAVEPLQTRQVQGDLDVEAAEMKQLYGSAYDEVAGDVVSMLERDPEMYARPGGIKAAFGALMAERHARQQAEQSRAQRASTLDRGGRSGANAEDAADAVRRQLREISAPQRDGL